MAGFVARLPVNVPVMMVLSFTIAHIAPNNPHTGTVVDEARVMCDPVGFPLRYFVFGKRQ